MYLAQIAVPATLYETTLAVLLLMALWQGMLVGRDLIKHFQGRKSEG